MGFFVTCMRSLLWIQIAIFTVLPTVTAVYYAVKGDTAHTDYKKNVGILAGTVAYNWLAIAVILLLIDKKSDCGSMFCSIRWLTKSWKNSRKFYSKLSTKSDWMIFCTVLLVEACVLALDIHLFKKFCYPLLSPDDVPKALNAASKFAKSQ